MTAPPPLERYADVVRRHVATIRLDALLRAFEVATQHCPSDAARCDAAFRRILLQALGVHE